jgi:hypothetical protein
MKEKYDGKRKNLLRNNELNYSGTMVRDTELWLSVIIPRIAPPRFSYQNTRSEAVLRIRMFCLLGLLDPDQDPLERDNQANRKKKP